MALTVAERKERLPHGKAKKVARRLRVFPSYISAVMAGEIRPKTERTRKKLRRAQVALALELNLPVEEAFPEFAPDVERVFARAS